MTRHTKKQEKKTFKGRKESGRNQLKVTYATHLIDKNFKITVLNSLLF